MRALTALIGKRGKPGVRKIAAPTNQPALALGDAPRWWAALAQREGAAARALQFLALTTARSGEARGMTWAEVTLGGRDKTDKTDKTPGAVWTVPASRMKAGRAHRVPLPPEAVAILEGLPRTGSPYVFPAPRGGTLSDAALAAVMRRMQEAETRAGRPGFLDPVSRRPAVPHGLRATFRQWAAEQCFPRDMSELALAHRGGDETERAYQRSDMLERRRAMMAAWAAFLRGGAAE